MNPRRISPVNYQRDITLISSQHNPWNSTQVCNGYIRVYLHSLWQRRRVTGGFMVPHCQLFSNRHVNVDEFKVALRQSTLYADSAEGDDDVDFLADQYNSEITSIADRLALLKTVTSRRRASDAWFDDECRVARKKCRWLERRCSRSPAYKKQWHSEFRRYRQLTRRKRAVSAPND